MKTCSKCGLEKSLDEFHKHPHTRDKRQSECKECTRARDRENRDAKTEYVRRYRLEHPEKWREVQRASRERNKDRYNAYKREHYRGHQLVYKYKLTEADYDRMLAEQEGGCAACGAKPEKYLHVDHDHACCPGERSCGSCVRGLLCATCNQVLGRVEDDIDRLMNLAAYVERYAQ